MSYRKENNKFMLTAAAFGIVGFVLLVGVMIFHQHINYQLTLAYKEEGLVILDIGDEGQSDEQKPIPDKILKDIIENEENILGYNYPIGSLSPAMKFLYTISNPDPFFTQK